MKAKKRWDAVLDRLPSQPVTLVEVGVWRGALAARLLAARPHLHMVLVDPWLAGSQHPDWAASGAQLAQDHTQAELDAIYRDVLDLVRPYRDRVRILRMTSIAAAARLADESFQAVFLDADHSREAVATDICVWTPTIAAGGWIGGHDYDHPRFPGVKTAVDAFCCDVTCGPDRTWFAPC